MTPAPDADAVRAQVFVLTDMARRGSIDAAQYNAGLICQAAGFIGAGRSDLALGLICSMPADYIADVLPHQAAVNEELAGHVEVVARHLITAGHVEQEVYAPPLFLPGVLGRA